MDKEILNMEEAAELFGVSTKTFIKLLKEEKVPARKIGREWRFSKKALINWLSSGDSQEYSLSEVETKDFFNTVAPKWEELSRDYNDESIIKKFIHLNILDQNMTVLDLGSGDGFISRAAAKHVKKVIAVDISTEMLKELSRKAAKSGINNIETLESDGRDVPLKDSSVDLVCSSMYLHHVEDIDIAIREMYRLLKPGGMVFLADYYEHLNKELKERMHDIWSGFNTDELVATFKRCGFKNLKVETAQKSTTDSKDGSKEKIFVLTATK